MKMAAAKIKYLIIVFGLFLVLLAAGTALRSNKVRAEENNFPAIIQELVDKFNLNKDEVNSVVDEVKQERRQERINQLSERLDQAVKDGVITADQKQALISKQQEMEQKQEQIRTDWQNWTDQSGINFEKLSTHRIGFGCGHGFGHGPDEF